MKIVSNIVKIFVSIMAIMAIILVIGLAMKIVDAFDFQSDDNFFDDTIYDEPNQQFCKHEALDVEYVYHAGLLHKNIGTCVNCGKEDVDSGLFAHRHLRHSNGELIVDTTTACDGCKYVLKQADFSPCTCEKPDLKAISVRGNTDGSISLRFFRICGKCGHVIETEEE